MGKKRFIYKMVNTRRTTSSLQFTQNPPPPLSNLFDKICSQQNKGWVIYIKINDFKLKIIYFYIYKMNQEVYDFLSQQSLPLCCPHIDNGMNHASEFKCLMNKKENMSILNYKSYLFGYAKTKASLDSLHQERTVIENWPIFAQHVYKYYMHIFELS
jgi:hypothetical protein